MARHLVVDVIPDLKKPYIFLYDEGVRCTLAYQDKKAPLVFLIARSPNDKTEDGH